MNHILAGDIGGTKTLLQISAANHARAPVLQKSYRSTDYAGLAEMLDEFLREAGAPKITSACPKMAEAVALAALHGTATVDWALGHAAVMGRFAEGDLASIIAYHATAAPGNAYHPGPDHTLQPGTSAWEGFGR